MRYGLLQANTSCRNGAAATPSFLLAPTRRAASAFATNVPAAATPPSCPGAQPRNSSATSSRGQSLLPKAATRRHDSSAIEEHNIHSCGSSGARHVEQKPAMARWRLSVRPRLSPED